MLAYLNTVDNLLDLGWMPSKRPANWSARFVLLDLFTGALKFANELPRGVKLVG